MLTTVKHLFGVVYWMIFEPDLVINDKVIINFDTSPNNAPCKSLFRTDGNIVLKMWKSLKSSVDNLSRPHTVKTLQKFHKIDLEPGESKRVEFTLSPEDFQYYHDGFNRFFVDAGQYILHIGRSSRDIVLSGQIEITYDHETEIFLQKQLNENSVGKDFLVTAQSQSLFNETFGHLLGTDLYEIILDMPMNLLYRLFPNLISREQVNELIEKVQL